MDDNKLEQLQNRLYAWREPGLRYERNFFIALGVASFTLELVAQNENYTKVGAASMLFAAGSEALRRFFDFQSPPTSDSE